MRRFSVIVVVLFFTCSGKNDVPDVSHIQTPVTVQRFDRDFFSLDTANLQSSLQALEKKYPVFLPLYFKYFASIKEIADQNKVDFDNGLLIYYRFIKPVADSVALKFPTMDNIGKALEEQCRYVKFYFPAFKTPAVITSVEGFNPNDPTEIYGTTYYNDQLIISLQMFLGKNYSGYDPALYPDYLRRRFEPESIVPNCIRAIASDLYADTSGSANLIEQMIEKGKQWWLMKKLLPGTPDSLISGYNAHQTEWLKKEEANVWGYVNQSENLFSIEPAAIQTYIGEAPFTQTMPHDNYGEGAPGNIGPWIGWRIVEKFEGKNPGLSVQQILHTPAKKIFQEARYKPK